MRPRVPVDPLALRSFREVARILRERGVPVSHELVRRLHDRAIEKLRRKLAGQGVFF
jgi:transposase-like protein